MPSNDKFDRARRRLSTATEQRDKAAVHSWEPVEPAECVTMCFYSFENALTAAMLALGKKLTTKHYEKARIAADFARDGLLKTDISVRLTELNDLRKDVQYGEPGEMLASTDLDSILAELEYFLDEVTALIDSMQR